MHAHAHAQVVSDVNFELTAAYLATFVGEFDSLPKKVEVEARGNSLMIIGT